MGDGTTIYRAAPVDVVGLGNVQSLSLGLYHTCAFLNDGTIRCWGNNSWGQVGDHTTTNRSTPVSVSGLFGPQSSLATGDFHTCAAQIDYTEPKHFQFWGMNAYGQLADGTQISRSYASTPVFRYGIYAVFAEGSATCAESWTGSECWGYY